MKRNLKIVLGTLASATFASTIILTSFQTKRIEKRFIALDANSQIIRKDWLLSEYPLELNKDLKITLQIENFFGKTIENTGYINKKTISLPGKKEKVDLFEWAEVMFNLTPRGGN